MRVVDEICDDAEATGTPDYCTKPDCRMDAACYVLNRIPQRYVSSARGHAHTALRLEADRQLSIDILTLAHEGLRRVSSVRRSFYRGDGTSGLALSGPHYYLPTIKGRLLHGLSFELVNDVAVELRLGGIRAEMLDARWQNPYEMDTHTAGTYLFWPAPVQVTNAQEPATLEFEVRVDDARFEPLHHFFSIERTSVSQVPNALEIADDHRLPDLYLLPRG